MPPVRYLWIYLLATIFGGVKIKDQHRISTVLVYLYLYIFNPRSLYFLFWGKAAFPRPPPIPVNSSGNQTRMKNFAQNCPNCRSLIPVTRRLLSEARDRAEVVRWRHLAFSLVMMGLQQPRAPGQGCWLIHEAGDPPSPLLFCVQTSDGSWSKTRRPIRRLSPHSPHSATGRGLASPSIALLGRACVCASTSTYTVQWQFPFSC